MTEHQIGKQQRKKDATYFPKSAVNVKQSLLLIGAIVSTLLVTSCAADKGSFLLINAAKEPIVHASVAICGQIIALSNIQPGESAAGSYDVNSDSHFTIEVEFQSGRKLRKETGYVTNGMNFQHEITVTDSDIEITDSTAK